MSIDEMIAVLTAAKEGKAIECRCDVSRNDLPWGNMINDIWNFDAYEYRIKPPPLKALPEYQPEMFVVRMKDSKRVTTAIRCKTHPRNYEAPNRNGVWMVYGYDECEQLSRAECEAAGYIWPEGAREP